MPHLQLLPAEPIHRAWQGHQIARYQQGNPANQPVLLVHSINAAASAFEMREPFSRLSDRFFVTALDLLGYGNSDRPRQPYLAGGYIAQIIAELEAIGRPTDLIASSLGAAYAIVAAARRPDLVRRLITICPVGVDQLASPPGGFAFGLHRLFLGPFGRLLFRLITARPSIRYFLAQQAYANPRRIDRETIEYYYQTSHQPGAYYAPICFLSGVLNCDVRQALARLAAPTLSIWGAQGITTPPSKAKLFQQIKPDLQVAVIDQASMLAQEEQADQFEALARDFFA